jgi:2-oxoglutarate ferredoxin oxidoreductase subunit beta
VWRNGRLEIVDAATVPPADLVVHDAHADDPSYAFALSRLSDASLARTAIGVFRDAAHPTYDDLVHEQIERAVVTQGEGDLAALLHSGDTWRIG